MAKGKGKNVNGHLRARLDYLQKAAAYLQSTSISSKQQQAQHANNENNTSDEKADIHSNSLRTVPLSLHGNAAAATAENDLDNVNHQTHQKKSDHLPNFSRAYISQLRGISLKTQLRLPQELKRSICKRCDTILLPGVNCTEEVRNASREGKKPWADVRVFRCMTCGTEKRYPQTDRRSKKLGERQKEKGQKGEQSGET